MNDGYIVQNIHLKRKPIFQTKKIEGAIHLLSCDVLSAGCLNLHTKRLLMLLLLLLLMSFCVCGCVCVCVCVYEETGMRGYD